MADKLTRSSNQITNSLLLFIGMLFFKAACDLGYAEITVLDTRIYNWEFNMLKYVNGFIWCIVLFIGIRHSINQVSSFMLYLVYLMQIIPITTIYCMGNGNAVYYNVLCLGFLICEILSRWTKIKNFIRFPRSSRLSFMMLSILSGIILLLIIYIVKKNGCFTLTALNIYKVYELRSSGSFVLSKYMSYLFSWTLAVIIPFFLAREMEDGRYMMVALLCIIVFVMYLYSGHKSYLFCIPTILLSVFWARRKNFYNEIFMCGCMGFFILVVLACYSPVLQHFFEEAYSLFGRRLLMVSANNKFTYYDFFSRNPKMGLGGVFPRWLLHIPNYYENIPYTFRISEIYYGLPKMNSNTGFMAEGYMRFGHMGTLLIMVLFAMILRLMDQMQKRLGYAFVIGFLVYRVLGLSDAHLIDNLFFGEWMVVLVIYLFYSPNKIWKIHREVRSLKQP